MYITIWGPFDKKKQKELEKKIKKVDWKKEGTCCHEEEKTDLCVVHCAVMDSVRNRTKRIFVLVEPLFAFNSTADEVVSYKLADIVSENIGNYHVECMIVKERSRKFFGGYRSGSDRF